MESKNKCWGHYILLFIVSGARSVDGASDLSELYRVYDTFNTNFFPSPGQSEPFGAFGPPERFSLSCG